ncbi:MAG: BlaI/MecI/CopY family transcriptional regulator [Gemmatimonadota bacterium]
MTKTRLTDLQLDLMRVLWKRGEATAAEVRDEIRERDLAPTTVATLLARLERQAVVTRRRRGRQYVYRPQVSEAAIRESMVAGLVGALFDGDPAALVSHLVSEAEIQEVDLEELRAMIDRAIEREADDER